MTREERENAIRHIETALDIDPWAKDAATKALSIDIDAAIEQMEKRKLRFGFDVGDYDGDRDALNFNSGIDTCIAILRGLEK